MSITKNSIVIDYTYFFNFQNELNLKNVTKIREKEIEFLCHDIQDSLKEYALSIKNFYLEYIVSKETNAKSNDMLRKISSEIEETADHIAHLKIAVTDTIESYMFQMQHLNKIRDEISTSVLRSKSLFYFKTHNANNNFNFMGTASHNCLLVTTHF